MRKIKVGLVFSGGGAKGAYHLGVWKAIRELGLENIIKGVSGSSIGALTGYMFSVKEYDKSYQLWYSSALETNPNNKIAKLIGYKNSSAINNLKNNIFLSSKKIDNLLDSIVNKAHLKVCLL
jgi:NTE family protein